MWTILTTNKTRDNSDESDETDSLAAPCSGATSHMGSHLTLKTTRNDGGEQFTLHIYYQQVTVQ